MAERFCNYCSRDGKSSITCERPHTVGEPLARLIRTKDGRQLITLTPIEKCTTRCEILNRVKEVMQ